jgi:hypothetical protein
MGSGLGAPGVKVQLFFYLFFVLPSYSSTWGQGKNTHLPSLEIVSLDPTLQSFRFKEGLKTVIFV